MLSHDEKFFGVLSDDRGILPRNSLILRMTMVRTCHHSCVSLTSSATNSITAGGSFLHALGSSGSEHILCLVFYLPLTLDSVMPYIERR